MELEEIQDFPALKQLGDSLWKAASGKRGAAIMVGAGFSRNAIRASETTPAPPLWRDLKSAMEKALYPLGSPSAPQDPLRLAEEYRSQFGQDGLDDLLRTLIRDEAWSPSRYHDQLLNLPWTDVLTTNYDTLLERAAKPIGRYSYTEVRTESELAHASRPRIIKLHGTMGGERKLIIAEEDYRTYPTCHAAFVNVCRQVFIENELCLLGFSGDDPNFLQWSGWVRDQLGSKSRRIYLVGALSLSNSARKLLESRNIAPIDFGLFVKAIGSIDPHAATIEAFLNFLVKAKPVPAYAWQPRKLDISRYSSDRHPARDDLELVKGRLLLGLAHWQAERFAYPGWIICPHAKRMKLKWETSNASLDFGRASSLLTAQERSAVLEEIVWRYETALWPLDETLLGAMTSEVESIEQPHSNVPRCTWFAGILLRHAREADDDVAFERWSEVLMNGSQEAVAQCMYQRCLRARDRFNLWPLKAEIETVRGTDPVWCLRRALLYCELDLWEDAHREIRAALSELRTRELQDRSSLWSRSRRAYAQWLATAVRQSQFELAGHDDDLDFLARLDAESGCDPWDESRYLNDSTQKALTNRANRSAKSLVPQFEPGSYRDQSGIIYFESPVIAEPWYELTRIQENAGIPLRLDSMTVLPMATDAVGLAYRPSAFWALQLIRVLRTDENEFLHRSLGRVGIAKIPIAQAYALGDRLIAAVRTTFSLIGKSSEIELRHLVKVIQALLTGLYRVAIRFDASRAREVFNIALQFGDIARLHHRDLLVSIDKLFQSSIQALPPDQRHELVMACFAFPLTPEHLDAHNVARWPVPLLHFDRHDIRRPEHNLAWDAYIAKLIAALRMDAPSRHSATLCLDALCRAKALSVNESSDTAAALWSRPDGGSPPLPANQWLYPHINCSLPAPSGTLATQNVRDRLFAPKKNWLDSHETIGSITAAARSSEGVLPTSEIAAVRFDEVIAYDFESRVSKRNPLEQRDSAQLRHLAGGMLAWSIVPALGSELTPQRCAALLSFIDAHGEHDALLALPIVAKVDVQWLDQVEMRLRRGILSNDLMEVSRSMSSVQRWAELEEEYALVPLPKVLIDLVLSSIEARREVGLIAAMACVEQLVRREQLDRNSHIRLAQAVAKIFDDLQYEAIDESSQLAVSISLIRQKCVELAHALTDRVDDETRLQLERLIQDAANDAMPEVRFVLKGFKA